VHGMSARTSNMSNWFSHGVHAPPQTKTDAQQLFGLPATEEVLEKFGCTLVQMYSCRHNAFTGPREVRWGRPATFNVAVCTAASCNIC